ncbi:hypothetical protein [Nocardia sp. NPDC004604]|uniref:hypothetical protein n=1 Tax=Nocardia sp. NPDC004604 TaxID=3157013 RepID=UPI0033B56D7B
MIVGHDGEKPGAQGIPGGDVDGLVIDCLPVATALAALDRRNPPPSVISGFRNRLMAAAARHLATRRQHLAVIDRMTASNSA